MLLDGRSNLRFAAAGRRQAPELGNKAANDFGYDCLNVVGLDKLAIFARHPALDFSGPRILNARCASRPRAAAVFVLQPTQISVAASVLVEIAAVDTLEDAFFFKLTDTLFADF